jgi:short-subunit dehydrogenase
MKLHDKVFLVTGAGGGIGSELVIALLARGAHVAAVDLRQESLAALQSRLNNPRLTVHAVDITDKAAVALLPDTIMTTHGAIDGVINCAGIIQPFVKVLDLDYDAIDRVMGVNFYGTLYMTKSFLPHLLARPEGYIVNFSSMGGFLPVPGQSVYGASKAAVKLFTEGLYAELRDTNVHVTAVFPGATETGITKNSGVQTPQLAGNADQQKFPMLSAKKVAEIVVSGMENNKVQIFTGNDSRSMNLLYRLNPVYATNLIANKMKSLLT